MISPIELRHKLHKNPEIAYQEFKTTELISESIKNSDPKNQLKIHRPFPTGLLVEYTVNTDPYILFRADIDALPIKEETEYPFKSGNDFMHACGHDVHTSILYSLIQEVLKNPTKQNLLFLFQPAEESGGGAMKFYETGIFGQFEIKNAFALHITDEYAEGTIASTSGVLFASALEIDIDFRGISAHVAFPGEGKNAFTALRYFMDEADKLYSKINDPFIFGVGKIYSGFVRNIAPGNARIEGSIRSLSEEKALEFCDELINLLELMKNKTGVNYKLSKGAHYPEVIVDDKLFKSLSNKLAANYQFIDCGYKMTGEDFGFFSKKFPSFMFWLGTSKGERYGLHNPKFLPADDTIETGKNIFAEILQLSM
ncbi:MAG: amidohydrolase [Ignavibacteriales bacterium]|nr:MAG: amidohydrolase [Ignavibacteriales bacterium]